MSEGLERPAGEDVAHAEAKVRSAPRNADAHARLAGAYHRAGRLEDAEAAYRRAIDLNPESALLQNNLGNVLADAGRLREALRCYKSAVNLDDGETPAIARLNAELTELEIECVVDPLEEAQIQAEQHPDDAHRQCVLACAMLRAGAYDSALQLLQRIAETHLDYLPGAIGLGVVANLPMIVEADDGPSGDRESRNVAENALAAVRQAALRHSAAAELHMHMAELLETLGRSREAQAAMLRAMELDATLLEASDLASRYARLPEAAEPFENLLMEREDQAARAFAEHRDSAAHAYAAGVAKLALVRFQGERAAADLGPARNLLERAVQLDRENAEPRRLLAYIFERSGAPQRALAVLAEARELDAESVRLRLDFAGTLLRLGQLDAALTEYAQANVLQPHYAPAALGLRYAMQAYRQLKSADLQFGSRPDAESSPEAMLEWAAAQADAMQLAPALEMLEKLLAMQPRMLSALILAGRTAHRLGDLRGAEDFLRRAVEADPQSADAHRQLGQFLMAQPSRLTEGLQELTEAKRLGG